MALIVDASAVYAQADAGDRSHAACFQLLEDEVEPLVTSECVVAEADYLISTRLGLVAELAFLDDLARGSVIVECLTREGLSMAREIARGYRDLELGLTDCTVIVLAYRHHTTRIATLDQRHFRAVTPIQGGAFTILPADR